MLELGKNLFDWIEIGAVGREEQEVRAGLANSRTDGFALVAVEIVHDHDIAGFECGDEELRDICKEAFAVDRAIEDTRRVNPVMPQGSEEGHGLPVAVRDFCIEPVSAPAPSAKGRHVGFGPGLIDEDQPRRIKPALILLPSSAPPGDVRPVLLAWQSAFF